MLDTELLASIAQQMMSSNTVDLNGKSVPVNRTSKNRLRTRWRSRWMGASIRPSSRMPRSRADGGNWHVTGIRCFSSRTAEPIDSWQSSLMGRSRSMGLGTENNRGAPAQSLATVLLKFLQCCRFF